MNKLGYVLGTLVTLSSFTALAAPTVWDIDPAHSSAGFSVRHMMVSTVRGEFGKLTGTMTIEGTDWKTAVVDASADVNTINTREAKRDAHLKSPEFFDAAKYPTVSFKSTKVDVGAGGAVKLNGNLTMHGVTKPVTFDVSPVSKEMKNPYGQTVIGTSATAKINRKDFGLTWNKPLEQAGGVMVGDEISVVLDLELDKKIPGGGKVVAPPPARK